MIKIAGNAAITKCTSSAIGYTTVNSATAYTNNIKLLSLVFIAFRFILIIFITSNTTKINGTIILKMAVKSPPLSSLR